MRTIDWMRRGLAVLGLASLGLGAAGTAAAPQPVVRPALWRVSDVDTDIYLFGTFHLLPQDYQWQTKTIRKAMDKSSALYLETLIDNSHPEASQASFAKFAVADNLLPLANRISPAFRPQLAQAIALTGLPSAAFDRMKTWAAAFVIVQFQMKALGLQGEAGVEPNLRRAFEAGGKAVGQLETIDEQMGFLDSLSPTAQRGFLEDTISDPGKASAEFAAMLKSWATGDVAGIARSFNADLASSPELRAALLSRRNQTWSRWIEQRMTQPGTTMVAVGAGHLAGDESVIALLERDGYKVSRVE